MQYRATVPRFPVKYLALIGNQKTQNTSSYAVRSAKFDPAKWLTYREFIVSVNSIPHSH